MAAVQISLGIAFLAGLLSFFSPCVLPLVPAYLSYLTGSSVDELRTSVAPATRARVLLHSLAFIAGFTAIFVALGASASVLGSALRTNQRLIAEVGGVVVIVLGLQMFGVFRLRILAMDKRMHLTTGKPSYAMSALIGLAFAAGWSPCIGPILAGILTLASQARSVGEGTGLLLVYSMGLALPFFLTALALGAMVPALKRMNRYLPAIEMAAGAFMIVTGIVISSGSFLHIAGWLYQYIPQPSL